MATLGICLTDLPLHWLEENTNRVHLPKTRLKLLTTESKSTANASAMVVFYLSWLSGSELCPLQRNTSASNSCSASPIHTSASNEAVTTRSVSLSAKKHFKQCIRKLSYFATTPYCPLLLVSSSWY